MMMMLMLMLMLMLMADRCVCVLSFPRKPVPPLASDDAELVRTAKHAAASNNTLTLVFTGESYFDVTLNWLLHYKCVMKTTKGVLVVAYDGKAYNRMKTLGVPVYFRELPGTFYYHNLSKVWAFRAMVIKTLLESAGLSILLCDADAIWLHNPLAYIASTAPDSGVVGAPLDCLFISSSLSLT